ncbi:hypothetical protein [Arenicella xantha]|nr:hypothetical protein [Arenicella xantha]
MKSLGSSLLWLAVQTPVTVHAETIATASENPIQLSLAAQWYSSSGESISINDLGDNLIVASQFYTSSLNTRSMTLQRYAQLQQRFDELDMEARWQF